MKFTIIGPAYPLRGGIAHHVYYLKRELTERSHEVQVVSFRKLYPKLLFPGATEFDLSASKLDAGAISVLSSLSPLTWARAVKAVKAFSPDVVIFQWWHSFFAPVIGTLARFFRRAGLRCVLECHNVFPHERSPFDVVLLKFATGPIDSFITHSKKDRVDLLPFVGGKQVSVCRLPAPAEFASESHNDRGGRTLLFFGTVRKYKGLEILLNALPTVLSQTDCHLLIAGEFYEPVEKYREMVQQNGLEDHVTINNRYIPNEDMAEIFERADVLVLPYLTATQSAVARIALSNGLPLIASDTGGLSETVIEQENGLLFPAGDSQALAEQIIQFFNNNLGPKFARNIRATAPGDSDSEIVDTLELLATKQ
jgi:glycosyltransferase involved in cell wall biosynthesis